MFDILLNKSIKRIIQIINEENDYKIRDSLKERTFKLLKLLNNDEMLNGSCDQNKKIPLKCGTRCFVMSLILLERLYESGFVLDKNNIIVNLDLCMIISFKLSVDDVYENLFLNLFNISSKNLFSLEIGICEKIHYKLFICEEEYNKKIMTLLT